MSKRRLLMSNYQINPPIRDSASSLFFFLLFMRAVYNSSTESSFIQRITFKYSLFLKIIQIRFSLGKSLEPTHLPRYHGQTGTVQKKHVHAETRLVLPFLSLHAEAK